MKKIKNFRLDKEVIATLSENELAKVAGGEATYNIITNCNINQSNVFCNSTMPECPSAECVVKTVKCGFDPNKYTVAHTCDSNIGCAKQTDECKEPGIYYPSDHCNSIRLC